MADTDVLRELHDAYVWAVNAAVGEDRMDLVWRLTDDYTNQALRLMSAMEPPSCRRPDCVTCARPDSAVAVPARPVPARPVPARARWLVWTRRRHAA